MCEVRHLLSTDGFTIHEAVALRPRSDPHCRFGWSLISRRIPRDNHFGSSAHYDLYHRFTCVCHTHCLAVTQVVVPRRERFSRSSPRSPSRASVHCPGRSLFRPVGSPGGTGGLRYVRLSFLHGRQLHSATSCRSNALAISREHARVARVLVGCIALLGGDTPGACSCGRGEGMRYDRLR